MVVQGQTDLADINVGVYNGAGADDDCITALQSLFVWMGSTVISVDATSIESGTLDTLDLLAFPGGSPDMYAAMLSGEGVQLIQQFVASGGAYFGVCGGGMFATRTLEICHGVWQYPVPGIPEAIHLVDLAVNQASTSPDLSNEPATYQVCYWGSHFFAPTNPSDIIPIMSYPTNDGVALCVARYGYGTIFICGPHPEFEEGSPRDGTTLFDALNDPDSEWSLLRRVTQWLIDEASDPLRFNPLAGIGGILVVVGIITIPVAAGIVFIFIRKRNPT